MPFEYASQSEMEQTLLPAIHDLPTLTHKEGQLMDAAREQVATHQIYGSFFGHSARGLILACLLDRHLTANRLTAERQQAERAFVGLCVDTLAEDHSAVCPPPTPEQKAQKARDFLGAFDPFIDRGITADLSAAVKAGHILGTTKQLLGITTETERPHRWFAIDGYDEHSKVRPELQGVSGGGVALVEEFDGESYIFVPTLSALSALFLPSLISKGVEESTVHTALCEVENVAHEYTHSQRHYIDGLPLPFGYTLDEMLAVKMAQAEGASYGIPYDNPWRSYIGVQKLDRRLAEVGATELFAQTRAGDLYATAVYLASRIGIAATTNILICPPRGYAQDAGKESPVNQIRHHLGGLKAVRLALEQSAC